MNTPHPDLETLAELADRDVPPASEAAAASDAASDTATAELLGHVAGCAACTADLEALRGVRETLRALPAVSMPADVAERIEAALLAARESDAAAGPIAASGAGSGVAPATVVPLRSRSVASRASRQRRGGAPSRWRTMPYGAAASIVVVLALIVVGAVAIGHSGGESKKSASPAASSAASVTSATIASGTNYTAADLRSQVASVVASNVPDAASNFPGLAQGTAASVPFAAAAGSSAPAAATSDAPAASAAAATPAAAASSPASGPLFAASPSASAAVGGTSDRADLAPPAPITAPAGPLADPAALARCIQILAGKAEQPLLVDYATFNGVPSTIIVLPDPDVPHKLDVYVEADTANCANNEFTFETFLGPSPGP